jgi:hypothetical protein
VEFDFFPNQPSEFLGGRDGLKTTVEFDGRLDIAVSKQPPNGLIISWMVLEINRSGSVSKLMDRHPQSDCFLNANGNLFAKE